jgi:hypothetical protein
MSEKGVSKVNGQVRFGDYLNGEFREEASYGVDRVEHDQEGVSLILRPLQTRIGYPTGHIHLNISTQMLYRLGADHERAKMLGDLYPGRNYPQRPREPIKGQTREEQLEALVRMARRIMAAYVPEPRDVSDATVIDWERRASEVV